MAWFVSQGIRIYKTFSGHPSHGYPPSILRTPFGTISSDLTICPWLCSLYQYRWKKRQDNLHLAVVKHSIPQTMLTITHTTKINFHTLWAKKQKSNNMMGFSIAVLPLNNSTQRYSRRKFRDFGGREKTWIWSMSWCLPMQNWSTRKLEMER